MCCKCFSQFRSQQALLIKDIIYKTVSSYAFSEASPLIKHNSYVSNTLTNLHKSRKYQAVPESPVYVTTKVPYIHTTGKIYEYAPCSTALGPACHGKNEYKSVNKTERDKIGNKWTYHMSREMVIQG